jgi:enoyl reductase-like protein
MLGMTSSEELENLNQVMFKQLKNRYADPTFNKRFVVGIDRAKMKLYNVEQSAQQDIVDDTPLYDKSQQQKFSFKGFK